MRDCLSLWRSPLDRVAETKARELAASQPRCDYPINQAPVLTNPQAADTVPIFHQADGNGYQVSLASIGAVIGGGGGGPVIIGPTTDFSALTIYNYAAYGALPSGSSAVNATAMSAMLTAVLVHPQGGTCFIPQFTYAITPGNFMIPYGTVMRSAGTGGWASGSAPTFFHFNAQGDGTLFNVTGPHNMGGARFIDLSIGFTNPTSGTTTAIAGDIPNVRAERCNISNAPIAFNATGLSCGLAQCTVQYNNGINGFGPGGATFSGNEFAAVILNAPEVYFIGPGECLQNAQAAPNNGPQHTVCIALSQHAEHAMVYGLHISHWSYGISYGLGAVNNCNYNHITNVEFASWVNCVYMQPTSGTITGDKYTACTFTQDIGSTSVSSCVYIDTNGQGNGNIFDIDFIGCTFWQANLHGLEINSGSNIHVIGGTMSGNGTVATAGGLGGAGCAITGACGEVGLSGVNMNAQYATVFSAANQTWALLMTGSPSSRISLNNCTMIQGYSSGPVKVTGTPTALFITNCPGYNDQNTLICTSGGAIAPTVATSASTGSTLAGGINYYGPSLVIFTTTATPTTFHYNATSQTVPANQYVTIYVSSPYDTIFFSTAPASFNWFGK